MQIGEIPIGHGAPLVLISGLNVLERKAAAIECARVTHDIAQSHGLPLVFKASFDKANRSRADAYRGPGLDEGLRILAAIKQETGLPVVTDIHEPGHAKIAAEVADCLQVPAFLCRQTDLIAAVAATGRPINLKKAQFIAPTDIRLAVDKLRSFGAQDVLVTDRGTAFGYNNLITDMRGLIQIREFAPVCFDATHSVQYPGTEEGASGGDRTLVSALSRAAVATGIDALFIEAHPNPAEAPCDGPSQIDFDALDAVLTEVVAIDVALARVPADARRRARCEP
ncbi:MAG: 3-deoxy-8-phosphooctulonate synthase [Myxococcota bacterium]|nr:3-deoxy-8-phosphooctulonate synthase [Myxococcota bacterium]